MGVTTHYTRVPQKVGGGEDLGEQGLALGGAHGRGGFPGSRRGREWTRCGCYEGTRNTLYCIILMLFALVLGVCVGRKHPRVGNGDMCSALSSFGKGAEGSGLLPAQAFVPEIPMKDVSFEFPTPYEDTSIEGDKLWDALMPIGSGFVRVPHPRKYDIPPSKPVEDDPEDAEIYSVSALHQLHCLGVIRDVIKKYEGHSKSRFAGAGHEYHCIDYIRQSIMCAGDTTLDYAETHEDGSRRGFTGANSTHQCRDWSSIVDWAVENRAGDKTGIA